MPRTHLPSLTQHFFNGATDCSLTHMADITGEWTQGEEALRPGPWFSISLCSFSCGGFFFGNRTPTDIKKESFSKCLGTAGRPVWSPSGRQWVPDAFIGDQIELNAPLPSWPEKNCPTQGLSCIRPRTKGKPQSLA